MAFYATNLVGSFGVPGVGVFAPGETREVSAEAAAWLAYRPEFKVTADTLNDYCFRDTSGRVRYLGYAGPIDVRFGYGTGGILILRALTRLGIEVAINPNYNRGGDAAYYGDLPNDIITQLTPRTYLPQVELVHCLPEGVTVSRAPRKIMWTMWETTRIPDGSLHAFGRWADLINANAELLVVPSKHNKEVFASCGVTVPIMVIPYGMDVDAWPYYVRPERDTFTVVQYGDLSARKGPVEAIEAFQQAFPNETNVRLILKTAAGRFHYARGIIPEIKDTRIRIIDEVWSRSQLLSFLYEADAFLWLSRGEGFGFPPLQAALTGLPVIMTTHTGMAEYYHPRYFFGVRSLGMSPSNLGGEWYEPDIQHAADLLRFVYEHRKKALEKGKQAASYIQKHHSLDVFATRLKQLFDML